jgi:hypothetical protein
MPQITQLPVLSTLTNDTYFIVVDNQLAKRAKFSLFPDAFKGSPGATGYTGSAARGFTGSKGIDGIGGGVFPIVAQYNGAATMDTNLLFGSTVPYYTVAEDSFVDSLYFKSASAVTNDTKIQMMIGEGASATATGVEVMITNGSLSAQVLNIGFPVARGAVLSFKFVYGSGGVGFAATAWMLTGGAKGFTGSSGFAGSRGYSGSVGNIGYTGTRGFDGSTGYTGSLGIIGYSGSAGLLGCQGYTGSRGEIAGFILPVADSGFNSFTIGDQSNPTLTLVRGFTYYFDVTSPSHGFHIVSQVTSNNSSPYSTGVTNNGATQGTVSFTVPTSAPDTLYYQTSDMPGMTGVIKISNFSQGYTGSQGSPTGFTGSAGLAGSKGDAGGYTGSQGSAGYTGTKGQTGFSGSLGFTGSRGAGYSGSTGPQGPKGDAGGYTGSASTVSGPQGPRGFTGSTGAQGRVGYSGSASTVAGPQGVKGDAGGYTGSKGDAGAPGGAAAIGFSGSKGDAGGYTGSRGYTGSIGSINDATDVDTISLTPTVGQALVWDGTNWVPGSAGETMSPFLLMGA